MQRTGRRCDKCGDGELRDVTLDWNDALPEADFDRAVSESKKAALMICVGTSLQVRGRKRESEGEREGERVCRSTFIDERGIGKRKPFHWRRSVSFQ